MNFDAYLKVFLIVICCLYHLILLQSGPNVMAENVQYLNKNDLCLKIIGCCWTMEHLRRALYQNFNS